MALGARYLADWTIFVGLVQWSLVSWESLTALLVQFLTGSEAEKHGARLRQAKPRTHTHLSRSPTPSATAVPRLSAECAPSSVAS
ncbi:hypothetical protein EDB81DRAFT_814086 [Dactylonectria macrodidyma]|uniref:Uncharacterized protein n=1 Tax=Dactylonectria macrodidyma TaxID=307937 RepID=A0A9P9DMF9_9HYPO|nr:hypothetical protein EDB81DRAFT_814086 [Dactylonectria macrodidyma]